MAEPASSSRTSARMAIGFITNAATAEDATSRDILGPTSTGRPMCHRIPGENIGGDAARHPSASATAWRETSGGGWSAIDAVEIPMSSGGKSVASEPSAIDASTGRRDGAILPAESRDRWRNERRSISRGRGRRGERVHYFGAQTPTRGGSFQSVAPHSRGTSPLVAIEGPSENSDSSSLLPPMSVVGGVIGSPRDRRRAPYPRNSFSHTPRESRHPFGVKRVRSLVGKDGADDEQGGEAKRVSSPHRLIRRSDSNTVTAAEGSLNPPWSNSSFAAKHQAKAGTFARIATASARNDTSGGKASLGDLAQCTWGQGTKTNLGEKRIRGRTSVAVLESGSGLTSTQRSAADSTVASIDSTYAAVGSSAGVAACRPRHRSLKVQRLNVSPMDTLTVGVRSLGVVSPTSSPPDVGNDHQAGDGYATGTAWECERQTEREVMPREPMSTGGQFSSVGTGMDAGIGAVKARVGSTRILREQGQPLMPGESIGQAPSGYPIRSTFTRAPSTLPYIPAPSTDPTSATPPSPPPTHSNMDSQHGHLSRDSDYGVKDGETASVAAMDIEIGTCTSNKEAPFHDAAVCTLSDDRPPVNPGSAWVAGGGNGGDVDDDSSDGGAAQEDISAWLHSTDDWWIS